MSRLPCVVLLGLICTAGLAAQAPPTPASLPRSSFLWTQKQREVGFAHWDKVFPSRVIKRGSRVHPLPHAPALAVDGLDRFIAEQKVAGILVLQDGKVRVERYELAGCCLQAGLRDYARFGQFVLDGGLIDGRSIVPDGWLEEATRRQSETTYAGRGYGYQWWTFDDGSVNAIGIHGQLIHIDRSRRLVVVTSSAWPEATNPDRSAERLRMLAAVAEAIDKEKRP